MYKPVSVVIPAKNAANTIRSTLHSVLSCNHVGEVVVVDDLSTDNTYEVVMSIDSPVVKCIYGESKGIAAALNKGIEHTSQPFVARCDADDLYFSDRFYHQLPVIERDSGCVAVSGGYQTRLYDGTFGGDYAARGDVNDITDDCLYGRHITHFCSWLVRRSALIKCGGARPWFHTGEDLDLMYRIAQLGRVIHVPRLFYIYILYPDSISHTINLERNEFYYKCAHSFALQRLARGADDLMLGNPPALTTTTAASSRSPIEVARNGAVMTAWREADEGRPLQAMRRLTPFLRFGQRAFILKQLAKIACKGTMQRFIAPPR